MMLTTDNDLLLLANTHKLAGIHVKITLFQLI